MANPNEHAFSLEKAQQTFLQKVYQWMAIGLAITGFVAYSVSGNYALMRALSGGTFFILMIAEFGLVMWLSSQAMKLSPSTALTGFLVYSALNGLTFAYLFIVYTHTSIATTFLITAATFAGVSVFGATTKTDLSSMRSFFVMGLIGLLVATVVNMFLRSPALDWLLSYLGVGLFIGLTAYDTQKLKMMQERGFGSPQMAVMGALMLYLDFINMFLFLLRLFGRRK
ncbi:MAG: hypothetical protein A2Y02_00560 [Omnitrophica bacterium GWA2_52_12]|nr:MAG: hypothetical protein A2Y02_00560 [Omnitrophica bacterium GWA2_52_12]